MNAPSAQRPYLRAVSPDDTEAESRVKQGPTDDELIDAVLQGDARIAGRIHDHLIRVIDHTLYRVFGRREHDHDDLIQTCFEQILRTLTEKSFAGNCSLRTWAGRITTYVALNALRARQRERRVIQHTDVPPESAPFVERGHSGEAQIELDRVRKELSSMKPTRAEVLVLHDMHGYHLGEIATMLGISVSAAQSRLVRGRKDLQSRLNRGPSLFPGAPS